MYKLLFYIITLFLIKNTKSIIQDSNRNVSSINHVFDLARKWQYLGGNRIRSISGKMVLPYTQRTSFVHFNNKIVGKALVWTELAIGVFANSEPLIDNKKTCFEFWRTSEKYTSISKNIPLTWSNDDENLNGFKEDAMYVYKPTIGVGGTGIVFVEGDEVEEFLETKKGRKWVIQEFVEPFLYDGKKTHFRALTLAVIRPDGTRDFFIYDKMRMLLAALNYDRDLLFDKDFMKSPDSHFMLATNLHANMVYSKIHKNETGVKFDPKKVVLDVETAIGSELYSNYYDKIYDFHSVVFSITGEHFECKDTDVSIHGDACLYIFATDIAMGEDGIAYILEMNINMGLQSWSREEIRDFSDGAASLMDLDELPYEATPSKNWNKLSY